ncbi:membrane protein [Paenibacillus darwinianus]|uniref:Membrane protein n=1 Tax=Paenibacillus darwinianus TaxID=1380763 RepID=A0A9W5RYV5_9BACL|nr:stage V sporulation protein B [Paenibacillus darwinianus]EXX85257.1 membrane protein [Paenibacillus darwinianus]EXX88508.1 membrane protein [Paenibacillus darwinianus]EXX88800.1 membrane protein [Paenibacillus darwinianus]
MSKQTFIKGAMILLAAGVINRILGFIPRIALPRIIGAEGVGLYQLGYPFMIVLITIVTGGIPLAVAKWVAEAGSQGDRAGEKAIFRTAMGLSVALAVVFTAVSAALAPWITTRVLTDSRVYHTFMYMLPMLLVTAVSSVLRGYFQGRQNMVPSALSQVVETLFRIVFVLYFAYRFLPYGIEWAAAGAMLGVVIGELCGLAVLAVQFWLEKRKRAYQESGQPAGGSGQKAGADGVLGKLLGLSVPVTGSKLVGSLSYLLESILTARSLAAAGILTGVATAQYGALQGMIIPVVLLPTALTYSLAVSLVPSLSEAAAKGDKALIHKRLHQSMRLALVTGAPFAVVMYLFAEPICRVLYGHTDIAPMLKLMALVSLFIYLQAPLQAALQALNKPGMALINTFIGAAVKLVLIVQLASRPEFGIYGALIAINVNIVLVTVLHGIGVLRSVGFRMKLPDFVKVGAAMIVMGAASQFVMNRMLLPSEWHNLMLAAAAGTAVYLLLMIRLNVIDRHDVARIPFIGRLFKRPRGT